MSRELSLTDAKAHFPHLVRGVEKREDEVVVTRNGRPAAVIMNYAEFRRLKETVDILSDRPLMVQIRKSRAYFKKQKRGLGFEAVFSEPLRRSSR